MSDLMNVVYLQDAPVFGAGTILVRCAWCDWFTDAVGLDDANDCKIDHENEHGIYVDWTTGEPWYDPAENTRGGGPA